MDSRNLQLNNEENTRRVHKSNKPNTNNTGDEDKSPNIQHTNSMESDLNTPKKDWKEEPILQQSRTRVFERNGVPLKLKVFRFGLLHPAMQPQEGC
jgi:hypothetical protein